MAQINGFNLGNLRQEEDFGFHQLVIAETAKCNDEKLTQVQTAYSDALSKFDDALKVGGANALSVPLSGQDEVRDNTYRGLAAHAKNMASHFDPAKAEIARQAELIINKYGNPCSLPLVQESGVLHNLIQDLEAFDNKQESGGSGEKPEDLSIDMNENRLLFIGAREWLEQLKSMNDLFVSLFGDRNTAQAAVVTGASKAARQAVDGAYRNVVKRINALAEVNGDAAYIGTINALNALIDRQQSILAARKTNNAKKKDDPVVPDKPDNL